MKLKNLLIIFVMSLFFVGTVSNAYESHDMFVVTYDLCEKVSEHTEEIKDNRNFLQPVLLFSYATLYSSAIAYEAFLFPRDNFIDIEKPPIIS